MKILNLRQNYYKGKIFNENYNFISSFSHELKTPLNGGIIPL